MLMKSEIIKKYINNDCKITFKYGKTDYIMVRYGTIEDVEDVCCNRYTYYRLHRSNSVHAIRNKEILVIEEVK